MKLRKYYGYENNDFEYFKKLIHFVRLKLSYFFVLKKISYFNKFVTIK